MEDSEKNIIKVNKSMMNIILKAHCEAEKARAQYYIKTGTSKAIELFSASLAFWTALAASNEPITDIALIAECKRVWDDKLLTMFPNQDHDFIALPLVILS